MSEIQGGQKVRVLLAYKPCSAARKASPLLLLLPPPPPPPPRARLPLLDEPTNHLDLESIHWLQDFLIRYQGTLDCDLARSPFPQQRLHSYRGYRLSDDHHLYRRL